jgi:cysteine desulfurase
MGEAFAIAHAEMDEENKRIAVLRDRLLAGFVDMEYISHSGDKSRNLSTFSRTKTIALSTSASVV